MKNGIQQVQAYIISKNGTEVGFHTTQGGLINLAAGFSDAEGFYIKIAPGGTEGLLNVKLFNSNDFQTFPFYKGPNSVLVKEVAATGHTATLAYWEK